MIAFLVRRVGLAVLSLALISFLAFGMVHAVPGSAAVAVVGTGDADAIAEVEVQLGLDRPLVEQYLSWAGDALRGDFGEALVSNRGQAVSDLLIDRLPATLALGIGGLLVSLVVGIPAGVMAALRPAGRLDRVVLALGSLWLAIPNFVFAIFAVRWLGAELGWFPVIGLPAVTDDPVGWLRALVLPSVSLSVGAGAIVARQSRGAVIDVLQRDYIRTALANGVPFGRVVRRHALRNASAPVLTVIGFQAVTILGGTVVVEQVFAIQGLGQLGLSAVLEQDFPVVQAFVMLTAVLVVAVNMVVDAGYAWADPRVAVR